MSCTKEGLFIVCDLDGKIQTVNYSTINANSDEIEKKLFINLFSKESIYRALEFLVEIKRNCAVFGWEMMLKPEYSTEPFYFGGVLMKDGISIFASKNSVEFANLLFDSTRFNNEELIKFIEKEKEQSETGSNAESHSYDEFTRLNNELIGMQRDLYKKNEEIKNKNKELEKLNSVKDKFFSIIAHDLKSPFQGLLGLSEKFAEEINFYSRDELALLSREMHNSVSSLFKLLGNLLEWSLMQRGTFPFNPVGIVLPDIINKNKVLLENSSGQKEIQIILDISDGELVFADTAMLNSILRNLLSNAVKFTKRGGKISVSSKKIENKMVEISITDNGIGFPEVLIEKLFKLDEKVGRRGTEGEESSGLGLILCKEFVEMHGGKIWVESKEGIGSTFYFTLPQ